MHKSNLQYRIETLIFANAAGGRCETVSNSIYRTYVDRLDHSPFPRRLSHDRWPKKLCHAFCITTWPPRGRRSNETYPILGSLHSFVTTVPAFRFYRWRWRSPWPRTEGGITDTTRSHSEIIDDYGDGEKSNGPLRYHFQQLCRRPIDRTINDY